MPAAFWPQGAAKGGSISYYIVNKHAYSMFAGIYPLLENRIVFKCIIQG